MTVQCYIIGSSNTVAHVPIGTTVAHVPIGTSDRLVSSVKKGDTDTVSPGPDRNQKLGPATQVSACESSSVRVVGSSHVRMDPTF
jgi:hypothetical protein